MSEYILLTGATGCVGEYLMRDLLNQGRNLAVVARPTRKLSARQRIEQTLAMWEHQGYGPLPTPVVLEGDVSQEAMGLGLNGRSWVKDHCRRIFHNAAAVNFHLNRKTGEPWRTNVEGTEHLIEFCRTAGIRDFHHVSTAYVCGARTDLVYEEELDVGQQFHNLYEESKFRCEQMLHEAGCFDQVTVYRPAVIAGDSQTGYTKTYHGMYVYFRLAAMYLPLVKRDADGVLRGTFRVRSTGDEKRNVVPMDWASSIMTRLFNEPQAHGRTFHLVPHIPITVRQVTEVCEHYFNASGIVFRKPDQGKERENPTLVERMMEKFIGDYVPYEFSDPPFDTTNLDQFVADSPCPQLDETILRRYLAYGEQDKWGRRKCKVPPRTTAQPAAGWV